MTSSPLKAYSASMASASRLHRHACGSTICIEVGHTSLPATALDRPQEGRRAQDLLSTKCRPCDPERLALKKFKRKFLREQHISDRQVTSGKKAEGPDVLSVFAILEDIRRTADPDRIAPTRIRSKDMDDATSLKLGALLCIQVFDQQGQRPKVRPPAKPSGSRMAKDGRGNFRLVGPSKQVPRHGATLPPTGG